MDEDYKIPSHSAMNYSVSCAEDVKDSPPFKERARRSHGNQGASPVKQHCSTTKRASCKIQQGAVFSGNILSFGCSVCKDDSTYSPNDLLKHFRGAHKGILPTYPCDLCGFFTNEFTALQRHRIEHKNTWVTCELCRDGIQYSLLLLTRHYIMCHSRNGKFHCDWCDFTTVDAGTFVQHIHHHNESPWKCSRCRHVSVNEADHQKHLKAHATVLPFICQICDYCASTSSQLKKHTVAAHKSNKPPCDQQVHPNVRKTLENGAAPRNSSPAVQNLLKNVSELHERQKLPKVFGVSGILPNQNGRMKSEMCSEEVQQTLDGTPSKKDHANRNSLSAEQSSPVMLLHNDSCGSPTNPNALKVLMVKNKISLPPNCTTKVMGFKMVDGKKHLVLKVIPVAQQNVCPSDSSSGEDLDSPGTRSSFFKSDVPVENGESTPSKSSVSHPCATPPGSGSCIQAEDIVAVKIKIEEEETPVFSLESPHRSDDFLEEGSHSVNGFWTTTAEADPLTNSLDPMGRQNSPSQTACSEMNHFASKSAAEKCERVSNIGTDTFTDDPLNVSLEATCKTNVENRGAVDEMISFTRNGNNLDEPRETSFPNTIENTYRFSPSPSQSPESASVGIRPLNNYRHCHQQLPNLDPAAETTSSASFGENATTAQNSLNHKVFAFHNYSKEAFAMSPQTCKQSNGIPEFRAGIETNSIPSHFRLTLAESSEPFEDSDCPDTDDENPESVLKDFNIIKIEEDLIPVWKSPSEKKNTSSGLGSFVEQHSEEIITQQLQKERTESFYSNFEYLNATKTTAHHLQVQDETRQLVLKTNEKTSAMSTQARPAPSFKLITHCGNPQINVSYMKSGFETSRDPTGETVPLKDKNIGKSEAATGDKISNVFSSLRSGASPHHFLINSANLNGPVLLSSASSNNSPDKVAQAQPKCYLLPRSIPFVQTPSSAGLKLASAKVPLNARPVLAVPVSSAEKQSTLQTGRQTFLLRYISPTKSSVLLNNLVIKSAAQSLDGREKRGNKVVFKIVSPTTGLLKNGAPSSSCQPLLLATSPPTQCFLMSSSKTNAHPSNNLKITTKRNPTQSAVGDATPHLKPKIKLSEADKPRLAPRPIRPPSRRKLRKKVLFDELPTATHKPRRLANKVQTEKDTTVFWSPTAKKVERTLRLAPHNCLQQIKCPRRYQPVVVLNHPDADIPEVANIMKVINRHRGAVAKVSLSQKTVEALAELGTLGGQLLTEGVLLQSNEPSPRAIHSSVRERFLLKLKLRKKTKKKYEVVEPLSGGRPKTVVFDCWFCGRVFHSQEHWVGHGQRHLMEATRDWNKLL
ncbi:zinc finger protein 518A [Hippocampus zosterae]|uniref:zinc finger protein 518A n=1 Tax=Hippocampus zosterae TaxID=109293 RepID=UPI00223D9E2B|nr:zinc finger protein 518A [Hippocampus zosterae]XP_051926985.1 zinc finger protein 518A [Hippocampus zosterae]XP_051926986.1 zinc finger protein 518A [Hippocampus zosterae]